LYYRCECKGVFPRLGHAVISTLTARRGEDGHRVFSLPALVAPYAGTMTAVYGWYPGRYDDKDAFRMGNYSLLGYVGGNIAWSSSIADLTPCFLACTSTIARSARSGFKSVIDQNPWRLQACEPSSSGQQPRCISAPLVSSSKGLINSFSSGSAIWAYFSGKFAGCGDAAV
jgi:hypothetical protein